MANAANYNDFFKMFGDYKMPAMDLNHLFSLQRRNIEALSAAGQVMVEGAKEASRRQAEATRECIEDCINASKEMFSGTSPERNTQRQADLCRSLYESAMNSAREISDMWSQSGTQAWDMIQKRANESVAEFSPRQPSRRAAGSQG